MEAIGSRRKRLNVTYGQIQPFSVFQVLRGVIDADSIAFRTPSAKVFRREIPVDQFIQHRVDIVQAAVLVIQVVSVFPHIDGQ